MKLHLTLLLIAVFCSYGGQATTLNGHKDAQDGIAAVDGIYDFVEKELEDSEPMMKVNSTEVVNGETCAKVWPFKWVCPGDMSCCSHVPFAHCCEVVPCCGEACCTKESPVCFSEGVSGCCPLDYKGCKDGKCCPGDSDCCDDDKCCPTGTECCGEGLECCPTGTKCTEDPSTCCPEETPKACSAGVCCEDEDCCGEKCGCDSGHSCCNDDTCCNDSSSSCCPKGCNACKYPWSALPCSPSDSYQEPAPLENTCPTPGSVDGSIYRILREDESCDKGLLALDNSGNSNITPKQHIACINDTSVFQNSPYITFSSDPKNLEKLIGEYPSLNLKLAKVDQIKIPSGCTSIDLTDDANIEKYLQGDQRAISLAKTSCPILVECGKVPIPCSV